jgi:hypothetical protein
VTAPPSEDGASKQAGLSVRRRQRAGGAPRLRGRVRAERFGRARQGPREGEGRRRAGLKIAAGCRHRHGSVEVAATLRHSKESRVDDRSGALPAG